MDDQVDAQVASAPGQVPRITADEVRAALTGEGWSYLAPTLCDDVAILLSQSPALRRLALRLEARHGE